MVKEWVTDYGSKSAWAQANQRDRELINKSSEFQEVSIRNFALKNHDTFRRTRSQKTKKLALQFYKIYFRSFRKSEYMDQMYFWYAELLFDSKKYISAVKAYEEVISLFPSSKYVKAAYLNQILALEKKLPNDKAIKKIVGKETQPVEMPGLIKSFIKVSKRYIGKFPTAKNTPTVLYTMAGLYYKFNQFSSAAQFFKQLSEQYPTHKLATNVGSLLLDIYNKNKDYKSLEELALKLAQNKNVDKALLKEVNSILEQISFKKAQDLSLNKQYMESALLYEKFAKENPRSSLAIIAFYNAGLNFEKAKDPLKAIPMYSSVLTYKTGKHQKIRKESQEFLALIYEKLGFYKRSASAYVAFARAYPQDSKSSDFWFNAGVIFDALNDVPNAVYSYNQYFASSKKNERHEIFYLIGALYERNRNWKRAIENYSRYLKTPSSNALRVLRASFLIAEIYETKIKSPAQAYTWHQKTLGLYRRLKVGVSFGARSHFYIVKKDYYDKFTRLRIPSNPAKQQKAIAQKLKSLKSLETALKPVIRYDDAEKIIDSLVLVGVANQEMAQAIYNTPIPKGLDKKGQAQYKAELKKIITPYIKKSLEHYRLAIDKSLKLKVYSDWISKAYAGFGSIRLLSGKFDRFMPVSPFQETFFLPISDGSGTAVKDFINSLIKNLKQEEGLSRSDFVRLSNAIEAKQERQVLQAVSVILNKSPKNITAINSLAFFYLEKNRLGMANLILNRLADKKSSSNAVIMNNLAVISLKYKKPRLAINYLKKALSMSRSYDIAKVNLANIFVRNYDYQNAYNFYKDSYRNVIKSRIGKSKNSILLLNNYSVSLTGSKKWSEGDFVFKSLIQRGSPSPESLFNYSCFLAEKSKGEKIDKAKTSLLKAKDIVEELKTYTVKSSLRVKIRKLSQSISSQINSLNKVSSSERVQTRRK